MAVSNTGLAELQTAVAHSNTKIEAFRASIRKLISEKSFRAASSLTQTSSESVHSTSGLTALLSMINRGTIRHAAANKIRLYRSLIGKKLEKPYTQRFLREVVADEYRHEYTAILDPAENYVITNPNQRAEFGYMLFAMDVYNTPEVYRYLRYMKKKLGNTYGVNFLFHLHNPSCTSAQRRTALYQGFSKSVEQANVVMSSAPHDMMLKMVDLYQAAANKVVDQIQIKEGLLTQANQFNILVMKHLLDPALVVNGKNVHTLLSDHGLAAKVSPSQATNLMAGFLLDFEADLTLILNASKLKTPEERKNSLDSIPLVKVIRGTVPGEVVINVSLDSRPLSSGGTSFHHHVSAWKKLVSKLKKAGTPDSIAGDYKTVLGFDVQAHFDRTDKANTKADFVKAFFAERQKTEGISLYDGLSVSSYVEECSRSVQMMRTLMRRNVWLS